jgi:hypothetical protein
VKLTSKELRARENAIFDALEHTPGDKTFLNLLYRDGVPTPKAYLAQRVRAVFSNKSSTSKGSSRTILVNLTVPAACI